MMGMSDGCNPIGNRRRFLEIACQLTKYKAESEGYGRQYRTWERAYPRAGKLGAEEAHPRTPARSEKAKTGVLTHPSYKMSAHCLFLEGHEARSRRIPRGILVFTRNGGETPNLVDCAHT